MQKTNSMNLAIVLIQLFSLASILVAERAVIDCPGRSDFQACYLTTENPLERNLATLIRGLEVDVIGRSQNGTMEGQTIRDTKSQCSAT